MNEQEKILTDFYKYLKSEAPTYRHKDMNTDLIVQSYLRWRDKRNECTHKWKYLSGSPQNELHKCTKCGFIA